MKRILLLLIIIISISCVSVAAKRGCCSGKGGVAYCGNNGHYYCKNGDPSPSCTCGEPDYTTYEEDKVNGDLYYEDDEDFVDSKGGNSLEYTDANSIESIEDEEGVEKYLEFGTLSLLAVGGGYSVGKYIGSKSKS